MALSSNFKKPFGDPSRYPPAASDEDLRAVLHRTADESVVFKHQFPPRFPISSRTFFGGLPTAPAGFRWPRAPDGTPYTFMAQVDCSELPDFQLRKFLPASGVLHFFVNWQVFDGFEEAQTWPNQVVLSRDTARIVWPWQSTRSNRESWREVRPPDDLPPCYGRANADYYFPWLKHTDRRLHDYPRAFAKKAMTMGVVRTFAEEHPVESDGNSAGRYQEIWEQEQTAELARFYGDPVTADELAPPKDGFPPKRIVARPTTTFPAGWIDIEVFCGLFRKELIETGIKQIERGKDPAGHSWPADPAAVRAAYEDAMTRAEVWIERSRSAGLMSPVPEADRMAFWSWLEEMNAASVDIFDSRSALTLNRRIWEAVRTSAHICLAASEAASSLVPAEMMGELRMEHSVLVAGKWPRRAGRHQMLGAGRDVQGAPQSHTLDVGETLLLQLDTDWAIPWMLADCGVLQYWISVSDLRAQRFDRVRVTLEGH